MMDEKIKMVSEKINYFKDLSDYQMVKELMIYRFNLIKLKENEDHLISLMKERNNYNFRGDII